MELEDIRREIRDAVFRSLECPIEEDRLFWIKCLMYWQIQLELHPQMEERDQKHKDFEEHIRKVANDVAQRTGLCFDDISYIRGVMHCDFVRGVFQCRVHCRDVEVIFYLLNSKLTPEEKQTQIKQILDTYSLSEERITDWYIP